MKKTLLWIIRLCSLAILFLPLYVDGSTIYPYTFSKMVAFQFLVEVSLGAYVILQFLERSYRVDWKNKLIQAQSVWIVVLALLSFISVDASRSWWSTAQWMTGTITYLHFYAWFIILVSVFKEWKEWRLMILASVGVSVAVALFGLGQLIGFGASHYDPELGRIYSTVGNPIYLAHYLLLHIFLAAFLFVKENAQFAKILLIFTVCILAGTIFFTGTRSAVLALFISLVLFFVLLLFGTASKKQRIISLSLLGALIACTVGLFLWLQTAGGTAWAQGHIPAGLQRLVYETFQDPARVELVHIAWQGFMAKPFFGWGPNNYSYVFSSYVKPHDFGILFPKLWYDQAHNHVMNILATTGIVGFLAYLLSWCVAWYLLWNRFISAGSTREKIGYSTIALFFFAYFLQNLTVFDTPVPLIPLYCIFAFVVFFTSDEKKESEGRGESSGVPVAFVVPVAALLTAIAIMVLSITPYKQGRIGQRAVDTVVRDYDRGLLFFQRTLSHPSFVSDDIRNQLASAALVYDKKYDFPEQKKKDLLNFAIAEMEEGLRRHDYSLEHGTLLLALYRSYAKYSPAALTTAEGLAQKLAERYPHRRDVLFEYVFIERDLGRIEVAKEYAQKIIDLDPSRGDAHWVMAQIHLSASNLDGVYDEIDLAKKYGYPIFKDGSFYFKLAKLLPNGKSPRFFSYLLSGWQDNSPDYIGAAALYSKKIGDRKAMQQDLVWLREHAPEYAKMVEDELKNIKK